MQNTDLDKKYDTFSSFLVEFVIAGYDPDSRDIDTVHQYVQAAHPQVIATAIREGREVLAMDPFPWGWVQSCANRFPCLIQGDTETILDGTEANHRIWVTWMVDELEMEAKRIGKIK